jgi:hypothetical protein
MLGTSSSGPRPKTGVAYSVRLGAAVRCNDARKLTNHNKQSEGDVQVVPAKTQAPDTRSHILALWCLPSCLPSDAVSILRSAWRVGQRIGSHDGNLQRPIH